MNVINSIFMKGGYNWTVCVIEHNLPSIVLGVIECSIYSLTEAYISYDCGPRPNRGGSGIR